MLEWTGERYLPFIDPDICGAEIHYEHLHRYAFASLLVKDACVLDLASGEGYGSYLVSRRAKQVIGIDIDPAAVAHAKKEYQRTNLRFLEGAIENIPIRGEGLFDVIMCFEAIEHIEAQEMVLREVKRLLKEDGLFIVSTPNKRIYCDKDDYSNPFHQKELYYEEFDQLLRDYFEDVRYYGQKVFVGSNLYQLSPNPPVDIKEFIVGNVDGAFVFRDRDERIPRYYIAVAGKSGPLKKIQIFDSYLVDSTNTEICLFNQQIGKISNELKIAVQMAENRAVLIDQLGEQLRMAEQTAENRAALINQLGEQVRMAEQMAENRAALIDQLGEQVRMAVQMAENRAVLIDQLGEQLRMAEQTAENRAVLIDQLGEQLRMAEQTAENRAVLINQLGEQVRMAEQTAENRAVLINQLGEQVRTAEQTAENRAVLIDQLGEQVRTAEQTAENRAVLIDQLGEQVRTAEQQIAKKDADQKELNAGITRLMTENWALQNDLEAIRKSITYRFMEMFQSGIVERMFPVNTKRRISYDRFLTGGRIFLNEGSHKFIGSYREYKRNKRRFTQTGSSQPVQTHSMQEQSAVSEQEKNTIAGILSRVGIRSPEYIPLSERAVTLNGDDVKLIAFYLPQYHPIPENDLWWGKGFTDWVNVTKAVPQFIGHYQPHFPDELGFYDLRLAEVQKRQIELARQYGIYGFCFHYYWFNGKRLLEKPLFQFIEHDEWDFPFCVCYANENWTRRWDGDEHEILIAQTHSPEDDLEFIKGLEPVLRDPRYIRINGKPILIVYRVTLLPESQRTAEIWRAYCREQGIGELYLIAAQTFGFEDPRPCGFDAAVEFPPHYPFDELCEIVNNRFEIINPQFSGEILDVEPFIRSKKFQKDVEYILYKTVCPGWDNTPRRSGKAKILHSLDPARYGEWLSGCIEYTRQRFAKDERLIFINAWNEWAEGAYLEPDRRYGYSFLQKTADTLLKFREEGFEHKKIIVVSHDALLYGAQMIALNLVKTLKIHFKYDICVILKEGGPLEGEFRKYARVCHLEKGGSQIEDVKRLIEDLASQGFSIALCNSVATGDLIRIFDENRIATVALVHELPGIIKDYGLERNAESASKYAFRLIFPSAFVKDRYTEVYPVDEQKVIIAPQGLYFKNKYKDKKEEARITLRNQLHFPKMAKVILAVGSADYRKGADLFFEVAQETVKRDPLAYFVWVGPHEPIIICGILDRIAGSNLQDRIQYIGERKEDLDLFYSGSDLFLLTSREDPFPSVVMEAMDAGLPVVGFDNAGGFTEIVNIDRGILVPYLDTGRMISAVENVLQNDALREKMGNNAFDFIRTRFTFLDYVYTVLSAAGHDYKKVSVILPSYNLGRYLEGRMKSIFHQSYPVYEVIFLDDDSEDDSVEIMKKITRESPLDVTIIIRTTNSGSVFRQWSEGIARARGDYLWITEADDDAMPEFLSTVMRGFDNEEVILSYSQSKQIDEKGDLIAPDYLRYTNDIDAEKWRQNYIADGVSEITRSLVVKNTIPNVSGAVFRKVDISEIIPEITRFQVCGDWRFYIWLLQKGKVAYFAEPLNLHRRYAASVTGSTKVQQHYQEIVALQDYIMNNFDVTDEVMAKVYHYREEVYQYLMNQGSS